MMENAQYVLKKLAFFRATADKVDFVDISLLEYDGSKYEGVSYERAMEEMTVIDEKNKIHRGVPAFTVMYSAVGLGCLCTFISPTVQACNGASLWGVCKKQTEVDRQRGLHHWTLC